VLAGLAADNVALNTIVWQNPAIAQTGTTDGLVSWSVPMTLAEGANPILFTAYDTSGNKAEKQIFVVYTPPVFVPPPVHIPAGHSGSLGVDLLLPLALLWIGRRLKKRGIDR
jgi:hypothetical protein